MKYQRVNLMIFLVFAVLINSSSCNSLGPASEEKLESTTIQTPAATKQPDNTKQIFSVDGERRIYWLYIPMDLKDSQPAPVVFVIHGFSMWASEMFLFGFQTIADQDKFIIVYPELGSDQFQPEIIGQILSDLDTIVSIDPKRIYAAGFSAGGDLAYKIACEMSDTFAAVAPLSGKSFCSSSQPENAVSLIHIHGLADEAVPYAGNFEPVEEVIAFWVKGNDCPISPQEEKNDGITHTSYAPCRDGTAIELYTIESLGHDWPTKEMSAAQIIWDFFEAHPKP